MVAIKTATKIVWLLCLVGLIFIPLLTWAITGADLSSVTGFVAACTGPMGVLTLAMAGKSIADRRKNNET